MNNEEKILSILTIMQADISELKTDVAILKTDVAELKTDVAILKTDVAGLKSDVAILKTNVATLNSNVAELQTKTSKLEAATDDLKAGQVRIENKIDKFAVIENDDVVALVKNTSEIRQNVKAIHTDVLYLVEKTIDNSKQILRLVK